MSRRHRLARLLAAIAQGLGDVQAVYGIGGIEVGQGAGDRQRSMPRRELDPNGMIPAC